MPRKKSRFGLNLFLQFLIIAFLGSFANYSDVFEELTAIMGFVFFFGFVYGFFRLLGGGVGAIESFCRKRTGVANGSGASGSFV